MPGPAEVALEEMQKFFEEVDHWVPVIEHFLEMVAQWPQANHERVYDLADRYGDGAQAHEDHLQDIDGYLHDLAAWQGDGAAEMVRQGLQAHMSDVHSMAQVLRGMQTITHGNAVEIESMKWMAIINFGMLAFAIVQMLLTFWTGIGAASAAGEIAFTRAAIWALAKKLVTNLWEQGIKAAIQRFVKAGIKAAVTTVIKTAIKSAIQFAAFTIISKGAIMTVEALEGHDPFVQGWKGQFLTEIRDSLVTGAIGGPLSFGMHGRLAQGFGFGAGALADGLIFHSGDPDFNALGTFMSAFGQGAMFGGGHGLEAGRVRDGVLDLFGEPEGGLKVDTAGLREPATVGALDTAGAFDNAGADAGLTRGGFDGANENLPSALDAGGRGGAGGGADAGAGGTTVADRPGADAGRTGADRTGNGRPGEGRPGDTGTAAVDHTGTEPGGAGADRGTGPGDTGSGRTGTEPTGSDRGDIGTDRSGTGADQSGAGDRTTTGDRGQPARGEPVPARGEPVPARGEPVPARGEPVPARGGADGVPARGEPVSARTGEHGPDGARDGESTGVHRSDGDPNLSGPHDGAGDPSRSSPDSTSVAERSPTAETAAGPADAGRVGHTTGEPLDRAGEESPAQPPPPPPGDVTPAGSDNGRAGVPDGRGVPSTTPAARDTGRTGDPKWYNFKQKLDQRVPEGFARAVAAHFSADAEPREARLESPRPPKLTTDMVRQAMDTKPESLNQYGSRLRDFIEQHFTTVDETGVRRPMDTGEISDRLGQLRGKHPLRGLSIGDSVAIDRGEVSTGRGPADAPGRVDPAHADPAPIEPGRVDPSRAEPVRADGTSVIDRGGPAELREPGVLGRPERTVEHPTDIPSPRQPSPVESHLSHVDNEMAHSGSGPGHDGTHGGPPDHRPPDGGNPHDHSGSDPTNAAPAPTRATADLPHEIRTLVDQARARLLAHFPADAVEGRLRDLDRIGNLADRLHAVAHDGRPDTPARDVVQSVHDLSHAVRDYNARYENSELPGVRDLTGADPLDPLVMNDLTVGIDTVHGRFNPLDQAIMAAKVGEVLGPRFESHVLRTLDRTVPLDRDALRAALPAEVFGPKLADSLLDSRVHGRYLSDLDLTVVDPMSDGAPRPLSAVTATLVHESAHGLQPSGKVMTDHIIRGMMDGRIEWTDGQRIQAQLRFEKEYSAYIVQREFLRGLADYRSADYRTDPRIPTEYRGMAGKTDAEVGAIVRELHVPDPALRTGDRNALTDFDGLMRSPRMSADHIMANARAAIDAAERPVGAGHERGTFAGPLTEHVAATHQLDLNQIRAEQTATTHPPLRDATVDHAGHDQGYHPADPELRHDWTRDPALDVPESHFAGVDPRAPGPLGDKFKPGIVDHDPNLKLQFENHERQTAELRVGEGRLVVRLPVANVDGVKAFDTLERSGPADPGRLVEYKSPEAASRRGVQGQIEKGLAKFKAVAGVDAEGRPTTTRPDGDIVIDGRQAEVTFEHAEQASRGTLTMYLRRGDERLPHVGRIDIYLGDGDRIVYEGGRLSHVTDTGTRSLGEWDANEQRFVTHPEPGEINALEVPEGDFNGLGRDIPDAPAVQRLGDQALHDLRDGQPGQRLDGLHLDDVRVEVTTVHGDDLHRAVARSVPIDAAGHDLPAGSMPPDGGGYRIELSDRALDVDVPRAVAHELGELSAIQDRAAAGLDLSVPDALRPGEFDPAAELSPHDLGRLAEVEVLARDLHDPALADRARSELAALREHLGLTGDDAAAAGRHDLVHSHLSDDARAAIDHPHGDGPPPVGGHHYTWPEVEHLLPVDDSGYQVTTADCDFLGITPDAVAHWASREAPLGMSPEQFTQFRAALYDGLAADGIRPDQVDIRLKGSASNFFSGLHKTLPTEAELQAHNPAAAELFRQWRGDAPTNPLRRPFDSMHRLGLDPAPSDYDIQISSGAMTARAEAIRQEYFPDEPLIDPDYGYVNEDLAQLTFRDLYARADELTALLGREVVPVLFPEGGPPDTSATGISSHFRPDDWRIEPPDRPPGDLARPDTPPDSTPPDSMPPGPRPIDAGAPEPRPVDSRPVDQRPVDAARSSDDELVQRPTDSRPAEPGRDVQPSPADRGPVDPGQGHGPEAASTASSTTEPGGHPALGHPLDQVPPVDPGPPPHAGPGHDLLHPLTPEITEAKYGMPLANQAKFREFAHDNDLVIDVRPTNPDSVPWLERGAIPKPLDIKAKTVSGLDLLLNPDLPRDARGLAALFEPRLPERGDMSDEQWSRLEARFRQRSVEYATLAPKIGHGSQEGQFRVGDAGLIQGLDRGGQWQPIAGDHDLFDIMHGDGSPMTRAEQDVYVRQMVLADMGVMHGAHATWDPATDFERKQIYEPILRGHQEGGEPLVRFSPNRPEVLVWAGTPYGEELAFRAGDARPALVDVESAGPGHNRPQGTINEELAPPASARPVDVVSALRGERPDPGAGEVDPQPRPAATDEQPAGATSPSGAGADAPRSGDTTPAVAPTAHPEVASGHDLSHPVSPEVLEHKYGMPQRNQERFRVFAHDNGLVIDVRPTNPDSVPWLERGALPKPQAIKAKTINALDLMLNPDLPRDGTGLVGLFEPRMPERSSVSMSDAEWSRLDARYQQRSVEYATLAPKIGVGAQEGQFRVGRTGLVEGVDRAGGWRPIAGDHDLYNITRSDGTELSADEQEAIARQMILADMGVMHGPHMAWNPTSDFERTRIYEPIIRGHQVGGEPLVRFSPGRPEVLVWAGTPVGAEPAFADPGNVRPTETEGPR